LFCHKEKHVEQDFWLNKMEITNDPCIWRSFVMVWRTVYYKLCPS